MIFKKPLAIVEYLTVDLQAHNSRARDRDTAFAMVLVYVEPIARRHYAPAVSPAGLYRPLCVVLSLIVSFTIALTTGNMWVKTTTFVAQPTVRFKYDVLMVFEGATPGTEKVWSTFASVNKLMAGSLASVDVQVSEQDLNMDGKIDVIDVKATAKGLGNVHGVKVLMGFDYAIDGMVDLALNGLAVAQHASPLPGSGYFVDGYLRLNQRDAIASGTTRLVYNNSVFPFAAHGESAGDAREAASLRLPVILNAYNFRNETTFLDAQTPVWETAASSDFTFNARIRIPTSQRVLYKPGFLELCKFAWVQILAIYVIFLWLFTKFEYVVFHHRLVNTRVVHDMTPKSHRF